jgi:hypothetical protein
MHLKILSRNINGRDHVENPAIGERRILKWIIKK